MFNKKERKRLGILVIIAVVLFLGLFAWCMAYNYHLSKFGMAHENFPWRKLSLDELTSMYKQEPTEGVVTTQSPEETHAKFITALRDHNWQEAVDCCVVKSKRQEYKDLFEKVAEESKTDIMIGDLEVIELEMDLGNSASYVYYGDVDGKRVGSTMSFIKNIDGVWLIESL